MAKGGRLEPPPPPSFLQKLTFYQLTFDSGKQTVAKKYIYKPLQIPQKLLVPLLLSTFINIVSFILYFSLLYNDD